MNRRYKEINRHGTDLRFLECRAVKHLKKNATYKIIIMNIYILNVPKSMMEFKREICYRNF